MKIPVLRLIVNNERFLHYVLGPVNLMDLDGREGGKYLAYADDSQGNKALYVSETGRGLRLSIETFIDSTKDNSVIFLQDSYLPIVLKALEDMHALPNWDDIETVIVSTWKEPATIVSPIGYEEQCIKDGIVPVEGTGYFSPIRG